MSYLVLARKYRPQTFEQVVNQPHVIQTLTNAVAADRMAHAILFSGPRGTGKTTIARILAKAMNCHGGPTPTPCNRCRSCMEITTGKAADVFEIDGASNNGVDQVRDLRENIKYMPQHSRYKIYIIDEVHMLSTAAFNALLKTLEEPPAHVLFFFATTEPHKIPVTILSRCQRHDLKRIGLEDICRHMADICTRESISISADSLALIAREAGGCMRDALSLLDQVVSFSTGPIQHEQILEVLGVVDRKLIFDSAQAILEHDIPAILEIIDALFNRGHDLKKYYAELCTHFRNLLVIKLGQQVERLVDVPAHEIEQMQVQARNVAGIHLSRMLERLLQEEVFVKSSSQTKLALEVTLIKIIELKPALPIESLIEKIDILRNEFQQGTLVLQERTEQSGEDRPLAGAPMDQGRVAELHQAKPMPAAGLVAQTKDPAAIWEDICRRIVAKHPAMATSLADCTLAGLTEGGLVIQVKTNAFKADMIQRKKALFDEMAAESFGRKMDCRFDIQVDISQEKAAAQNGRLREEALRHPLVAEAVELFQGKIVDVKIL